MLKKISYKKIRELKENLAVCILFAFCFMVTCTQSVNAEENDWKSKVDENVLELMCENLQQKISVYIFFDSYKEEELNKKLKSQGIDMELYKDTEKFNGILRPMIEDEVIRKVGFEKAYEKDMSVAVVKEATGCNMLNRFCEWECLASAPSLISEAINDNISTYKKERAKCVRELCTEYNQEFIELYNIKKNDIIYSGKQVRAIIIEATAEEIERYAKQVEVQKICYFNNQKVETDMSIAIPLIGADSYSGTRSMGYTGSGIKIGIIEAEGGKYNINNPHLSGKSNISYFKLSGGPTGVITNHATAVTSIICGNDCSVSSRIHGGIVPNAIVKQTSITYMTDVFNAIEHMVSLGMDIINISLGVPNEEKKYTSDDKMLDLLIAENDIICVKSAGNVGDKGAGYINIPALALNVITVGCVDTSLGKNSPFSLSAFSSYQEPSCIPNKPDICAPGVVWLLNDSGKEKCYQGTSFSAPIVTGVIAQMLQANPELKANPTLVKSKLLLAADNNKISKTNNVVVNYYQTEKGGAGMVNAKAAVAAAKSSNHKTVTYRNQPQVINTRYYAKGEKIRIVMVMSNEDEKDITSTSDLDDADLVLLDPSGNIVAESTSGVNNVEIIEYTMQCSGNHTIRVDNYGSVMNINAKPEISVSWNIN